MTFHKKNKKYKKKKTYNTRKYRKYVNIKRKSPKYNELMTSYKVGVI